MIAAWMVYCLVIAVLLGGAAHAAERLLRLYGRPARWVWIAALAGSVGLPLLNLLAPRVLSSGSGLLELGNGVVVSAMLLQGGALESGVTDSLTWGIDRLLVAGWHSTSAILLGLFAWSSLRLTADRTRWTNAHVGGLPVLVSGNVGPAVVGLVRQHVVVPSWVMDLSADLQRVICEHEREHARAGDIRLLLAALALAVLLPWNLALWWQLSRLRLAVEADCDRRVVLNGFDVRAYATLLLEVGGRGRQPQIVALALAERRSSLARRIAIMTHRPTNRTAHATLALAAGAAFLMLACETPAPAEGGQQTPTIGMNATLQSEVFLEPAVDKLPERISSPPLEYPREMQQQGIEGLVMLSAIVGSDGAIEPGSVEIVSSEHEGFNEAAIGLLRGSTFRPGEIDGEPVRVRIEMPVQFRLFGGSEKP